MISGSAAQVETNVINVLVMEEKLSAPSTISVFGGAFQTKVVSKQ